MLQTISKPSEAFGLRPRARRATRPRATAPAAASPDLELRFEREAIPHMGALFATASRLVRRTADAEDLVQETFLRAYRAFHLFVPGTNIRAWLFTILYRVRADHFRKLARSLRTVELDPEGPMVAPAQEALANGYEDLRRALARLPEPFRSAVLLRDLQDFSYEEIAQILGVPIGTVMSRIHRGRTQLRGMLEGARA